MRKCGRLFFSSSYLRPPVCLLFPCRRRRLVVRFVRRLVFVVVLRCSRVFASSFASFVVSRVRSSFSCLGVSFLRLVCACRGAGRLIIGHEMGWGSWDCEVIGMGRGRLPFLSCLLVLIARRDTSRGYVETAMPPPLMPSVHALVLVSSCRLACLPGMMGTRR